MKIANAQVRIKELQAENARLKDLEDSTAKRATDGIPLDAPSVAAFWSQNSQADSGRVLQLQTQIAALQEAMESCRASADVELKTEQKAHGETSSLLAESRAALEEALSREQARAESSSQAHADLQQQMHHLQARLQSQQEEVQTALAAEQSEHALTKQSLAEITDALQSSSSSHEAQLNEERARHKEAIVELAAVKEQLALTAKITEEEVQAEQRRQQQAQHQLDGLRRELAATTQAKSAADAALTAERSAREQGEQFLQTPAMLETLPMVAELRSKLQEEQATRIRLQRDVELLQEHRDSLVQENERLGIEVAQLQQLQHSLADAEASMSALKDEAASYQKQAEQERMEVANLQLLYAQTAAALVKKEEEGNQLQRDLDAVLQHLEEARVQHSTEAGLGMNVLREQLSQEQQAQRKSQAELQGLRLRLEQAEGAMEASTAAALAERDAFWKGELQRAQQELQSYQTRIGDLEEHCQKAEAQLLSASTRGAERGISSTNGDVAGPHGLMENPLFGEERSPAKVQLQEADHDASEVAHLRDLLAAAEQERDRAKQQLKR